MDDTGLPSPSGALIEHLPALERLVRALALNPSDADDIVQDTVAAALERKRRTGGVYGGIPWLKRVARSRAIDRLRWRSVRRSSAAEGPDESRSTDDPAEIHERLERHAALVAALMELCDEDRHVVTLRYFDGLTPAEIGARTSTSASTVRSRLQRALQRLRCKLEDRHGTGGWVGAAIPITQVPRPRARGLVTNQLPLLTASAVAMGHKVPLIVAGSAAALVVMIAVQQLAIDGARTGPGEAGDEAVRLAPVERDRRASTPVPESGGGGRHSVVPEVSRAKPGSQSMQATAQPAMTDCISGRVLLLDGTPVDGLSIGICPAGSAHDQVFDREMTDEAGGFELRTRSEGSFDLWVGSAFSPDDAGTTSIPSGTAGLEIRIDALRVDLKFESELAPGSEGGLSIDPVGDAVGPLQYSISMNGFEPPGDTLTLRAGSEFALAWTPSVAAEAQFGLIPADLPSGRYEIPMQRNHPNFGRLEFDLTGAALPDGVSAKMRLTPIDIDGQLAPRRQEVHWDSGASVARCGGVYPSAYRVSTSVAGPPDVAGLIQLTPDMEVIHVRANELTAVGVDVSIAGGVQVRVVSVQDGAGSQVDTPYYELHAFEPSEDRWRRLDTSRSSESGERIFAWAFPSGVTSYSESPLPPGVHEIRIECGDWKGETRAIVVEAGAFTPVEFVGMK